MTAHPVRLTSTQAYLHHTMALTPSDGHRLMFRGQASSAWSLQTTLERFTDRPISLGSYLKKVSRLTAELSIYGHRSFTIESLPDVSYFDAIRSTGTLDCMIYLRHIGFPSPLLDWTYSPYIALWFAFAMASPQNDVAIFVRRPDRDSALYEGEPCIDVLAPDTKGHERYYIQQGAFTIAFTDGSKKQFGSHDAALKNSQKGLIEKIVLPGNIRDQTLDELNSMNINAFTLYRSEEGLAQKLAQEHLR